MPQEKNLPGRPVIASLAIIATIVVLVAAVFAYTAGWLSPDRLTPDKFVDAFKPATGAALGRRRNHVKGICFTGTFQANGAGTALSKAQVFAPGEYPVVGRFNLGTPDPNAPDATVRVRGISLRISTPDGQEWRSAMINAPFFVAATPRDFHAMQIASASKDPQALPAFAKAHPEFAAFGAWGKNAPWTASYAEERYNGLNTFIFTDASGAEHAVRWSLLPAAQPVAVSPDELAKRGADFLDQDLYERIAKGPLHWTMMVTVAAPGDPTADPTKVWPSDRKTVDVGTLTVDQVIAERDGPCRDLNFDPTVLPEGIKTSDDPFPAARSSIYANSFDRRTAEYRDYPRTATEKQP